MSSAAQSAERSWAAEREAAKAPARWVEPLAITVLVLALIWVFFGVLEQDPTDTSKTDHVDPWNSYMWLALLLLATPVLEQRWREFLALMRGSWLLLMLLGYFALSVTWALDPSTSFRRFLFVAVQVSLFGILLTGIRRTPAVHVVIVVVCAAAAVADIIYWVIAPGLAMDVDGFAGMQGQKNQAGLMLMYGCLAAAPCLFLLQRRLWRVVFAASIPVMFVLLMATRSTTSQSVVFSAAIVMPALLWLTRLPTRAVVAIFCAGIFAVVLAAFGYFAYCSATGMDPMLPLRNATFSARTGIWLFTIDEIKKRPWVGAGYGSFWSINPAVQPSLKSDQWFGVDVIINEAHDGYLDLLASTGVIGLIGALAVLFRTIKLSVQAMNHAASPVQAWRDGRLSRPTAVFYLAFSLGLVVHNFTESNLFFNNGILAVGLLICMLDLEKWRLAVRAERSEDASGRRIA